VQDPGLSAQRQFPPIRTKSAISKNLFEVQCSETFKSDVRFFFCPEKTSIFREQPIGDDGNSEHRDHSDIPRDDLITLKTRN
jgi:hypothetical protein